MFKLIHLAFLFHLSLQATTYTAFDHASLVTAINNANSSGTPDTINLTANITISINDSNNVFNADGNNGLPSIETTQALLINGNGSFIERDVVSVDFRLLHMAKDTNVTIKNLTLKTGLAKNAAGDARGGAIYNLGNLTIIDSAFEENYASGVNRIPFVINTPPTPAYGGAIYHGDGSLSISNTIFNSNQAQGGPPVVLNSPGTSADGGAIYAVLPAVIDTISGCTFNGNMANAGSGGGAVSGLGQGSGGDAHGGAISLNHVIVNTITNTVFTENQANGGNSPTPSQNFFAAGNSSGGAIYQLHGEMKDISFSTFDNNQAAAGTRFASGFGGIGLGGAISLSSAEESAAQMLLKNSALINNRATGEGRFFPNISSGGALSLTYSVAEVNNSTLSGNAADGLGGGIYIVGSIVDLIANTITNNSAADGLGGGGIYISITSVIENLISNIVAANSDGEDASGQDIFEQVDGLKNDKISTIAIADFNLIGVAGFNSGNYISGGSNIMGTIDAPLDPLLNPLANNGGPTPTHKLQAASLAINAGSNPILALTDQRGTGFVREAPISKPDIGAFELQCDEQAGLCPADSNGGHKKRGGGGSIRNYPWSLPFSPIALPTVVSLIEEPFIDQPSTVEAVADASFNRQTTSQGCSGSNTNTSILVFLLAMFMFKRSQISKKKQLMIE